jgi:formate hydrogenlyase subunit 6/NADH:ubiquinone oxidoreductase subunit I
MCELYCPVDALYVAPEVEPLSHVDEAELIASGVMGSYRRDIGWSKGQKPQAQEDASFIFSKMQR